MAELTLREATAAWLEESRERFRQVAVRLGVADRVTVAVPVQHFGDDPQSTTGTYEHRVVSPFVFYELDLSVEVARSGEPLHGDHSVALARAITAQSGVDVTFFTYLSPATIAQRLQDPSVLGDLDDSDPIVFALALLDLALPEYLASLSGLGGDLNEALRVADELLAFVAGQRWTTLVSVPVAGLASSALLEAGPVRIRAMSPEEGGQLSAGTWDFLHPRLPGRRFRRPSEWWNGERHVIEVRTEIAKTEAPSASPTWKKVILALQLEGYPVAGPGFGFGSQEPDWLSVGFTSSPVDIPRRSGEEPRELTPEGLNRVVDLADCIDDAAVETPVKPPHIALRRFSLGTARRSAGDSIVDNVVALEALLLPGTDTRELGFRFAINGALYLGDTTQERMELKAKLADVYGLRSGLVHGGRKAADPAKIADGAKKAHELARRGLVRALRDGWPSEADFLALLLGCRPAGE